MRKLALLSLGAALAAGTAAGWWAYRVWREDRALSAVIDVDPGVRAAGWRWLLAPDDQPRARRLRPAISSALADAPQEAVLDAADALRTLRLWGWDHEPRELVRRELELRSRLGHEADQLIAARAMLRCPLPLDPGEILPLFDHLLASTAGEVRGLALDGACMWLGRSRAHHLGALTLPPDHHHLRRMSILARAWGRHPGSMPPIAPDDPPDVVEAKLLYHVRANPANARPVLDVLAGWTDPAPPAFAAILRYSRDPDGARALRRLADAGDRTARLLVDASAPPSLEEAWRRVLHDPLTDGWQRRLAAWHLDSLRDAEVATLLADDPAEPGGSVYAAALVAERILARDESAALAASWIRDFNDDRKRAGAVLAALVGEHRSLLRQACELEDIPEVKVTQRLALFALGERVGRDDPLEFAYRTLRKPNGDFDPDTALCLLLAGHRPALEHLTTRPPLSVDTDWRESVQQRAWLIERFVRVWHEAAGRPIAADPRAVRLHFDALCALRLLTQRRLAFDPETKTYVLTGGEREEGKSDWR
ncbi:MAG: hypothetical protein ACYS0G_09375 [Planctomycetota bacterium]|jgi:hypothetical protein